MKKILQYTFIFGILAVLLLSLMKTVFFPEEINHYENRYAEKMIAPNVQTVLNKEFQESVDAALSDQIFGAETIKRCYNAFTTNYLHTILDPIRKKYPNRYFAVDEKLLYGDYILYHPIALEEIKEELDNKIEGLNQSFANHPEIDFHTYYIEKDTDINFETNEQSGIYEYLKSRLHLPKDHIGVFEENSFESYSEQFYRTDHHWNAVGSYMAYCQILKQLKPEEQPIEPMEMVYVGEMSGSKAKGKLSGFSESFEAYRFDYPPMTIKINGEVVDDYGNQQTFLNHDTPDYLSYGTFYGGDPGEVIFDSGTHGRGSILVVGESHDNAILKLLASHYDTTYAVDLRNYEHYAGKAFSFAEHIEAHPIDTVLLIGSVSYYRMPEFLLEGRENGVQ